MMPMSSLYHHHHNYYNHEYSTYIPSLSSGVAGLSPVSALEGSGTVTGSLRPGAAALDARPCYDDSPSPSSVVRGPPQIPLAASWGRYNGTGSDSSVVGSNPCDASPHSNLQACKLFFKIFLYRQWQVYNKIHTVVENRKQKRKKTIDTIIRVWRL